MKTEDNRKDEIWNECFPKCSTLRETWRLAMEQYAKEYHESEVKKFGLPNISFVSHKSIQKEAEKYQQTTANKMAIERTAFEQGALWVRSLFSRNDL